MAPNFHSTAQFVHAVLPALLLDSMTPLGLSGTSKSEWLIISNALTQICACKQASTQFCACLHACMEQPTAHLDGPLPGMQSSAHTLSKTCAQAVPADGRRPGDAAIYCGRLHGTSLSAAVGGRGGKRWTHRR